MGYDKTFEIKWSDCDPNRHARNTVYSELATHVRFSFLRDHGFPPDRFAQVGFGPVILVEELRYFREVKLGESVRIDYQLTSASEDGSRFRVRNTVYKSTGEPAVRIDVTGGWLHLERRKLMRPPDDLIAAMENLERTPDFEKMPTSGS